MFTVGMKRAIEEEDIYAVADDMRSEQNTKILSKLWHLELKKESPSILRVLLKVYGFNAIIFGLLFSVGETLTT